MPYDLVWERGGVTKRFSGFVTGREFVRAAEQVSAHPEFDHIRFIINHYDEVVGHTVDAAALEGLAVVWLGSRVTNPQIRVVVVCAGSAMDSIVSALHQPPFIGTYQTRAFAALAQARDWLAKQPPLRLNHAMVRK